MPRSTSGEHGSTSAGALTARTGTGAIVDDVITAEADEGCDTLLCERTFLMLMLSPGNIVAPGPSRMSASEKPITVSLSAVVRWHFEFLAWYKKETYENKRDLLYYCCYRVLRVKSKGFDVCLPDAF